MSSNVTEIHGNQQHYRVTLEEAIAHYKNRDLTAKGLLHFYIKIRCRPGWLFRKTQKALCAELGMSRTTFMEALAKLQAEGVINCTVPDSTEFTIRLNGPDSEESDGKPSDCRETVRGDTKPSGVTENRQTCRETVTSDMKPSKQRPEPLSAKDSTTPSYSSHSSYQIFLKSLSEEERERFLKFSRKKAEELQRQPVLVDAWIARHFEDLARQWRESEAKTTAAAPAPSKWENHPRREEWAAQIASQEYLEFKKAGGIDEMRDRADFYRWAATTGLPVFYSYAS